MFCPNCGTKNKAGDKFCIKCGTQLPELKKRKGGSGDAGPPPVQQIIIKQKANWINLLLGVLLLTIVFCVGSILLMDATDTSAATFQEMIAQPQLYFEGLGRLGEQLVVKAQIAWEDIRGGDNGDGGDVVQVADQDENAANQNDPCANLNPVVIAESIQVGEISAIFYSGFSTSSAVSIKVFSLPDRAAVPLEGNDDIGGTDDNGGGADWIRFDVEGQYLVVVEDDLCGVTADAVFMVTNSDGQASSNDICTETFYDAPTFKAVNWSPADTLNIEGFLPMNLGGYEEWVQTKDIALKSDLGEFLHILVNDQTISYCSVPSASDVNDLGTGLNISCQYVTDREILQMELASVSLFGFDCPDPLAVANITIPPKELEAFIPPSPEPAVCGEHEHLNKKGKCVPDNPCNVGDIYAVSEGVCCAPAQYVEAWDSCDSPYYTP